MKRAVSPEALQRFAVAHHEDDAGMLKGRVACRPAREPVDGVQQRRQPERLELPRSARSPTA